MGDLLDVATRASATPPFDSSSSEYMELVDIFEPFKDLIIGSITGNHEARIRNYAGFDPNELFCRTLNITYCRWSAIINLKVGRKTEDARPGRTPTWRQTYHLYAHHSKGGGGSIGNALNRAVKMRDLVEGCDAYLIGHNHQMATASDEITIPSGKKRRRTYVCCGSYVSWDNSYAEEFGYPPSKLGSPRIMLAGGNRKDVHVSL